MSVAAVKDRFVGSKGGAGIAQWIISAMPAHRIYIEAFLGKGVILKTKLRASRNIGIEADPKVISHYHRRSAQSDFEFLAGSALTVLPALKSILTNDTLIYADPPYLGTVRIDRNRDYYRHELKTDAEHNALLDLLLSLPCMVMISGYQSQLYCRRLAAWRTDSKWTVTRGGTRVQEFLWMNFPEPIFYHDTRFMGSNFTNRQGLKRKVERWKKKFLAMRSGERFAILDALSSVVDATDYPRGKSDPTLQPGPAV